MSMNIFRLSGDMLHLVAILMVLHRVVIVKNAQGVSRKTQELFLLTFLCRYLDLLTTFYSMYNSVMKVFYIFTTAYIVYSLSPMSKSPAKETYRADQDDVAYWKYLVAPSAIITVLTYLFQHSWSRFNLLELLWTFSLYLEAVAAIPQILLYRKYRQVETLTGGSFIMLMGIYRGFYILNWIYRADTEPGYKHHWVVYYCGAVQVTVCFIGVLWPTEGREPAPLLPQLIDFFKEVYAPYVVFLTVFCILGELLSPKYFTLVLVSFIFGTAALLGVRAALQQTTNDLQIRDAAEEEEEDESTPDGSSASAKSIGLASPSDPLLEPLSRATENERLEDEGGSEAVSPLLVV